MFKIIHIIRKYGVVIFSLSFYMLSIYYFFFWKIILWWLLFAILFFIFAHYFIVELKKIEITNLLFIVIVAMIFEFFLVWFDNFFYIVWILLFNLSVFFLFYDIYDEVYNRILINSYKVFTMWVKMYSLILSLVFAVSFLWTYRTFNLTCNKIYNWIHTISSYTLATFWVNIPNVKHTKVSDIVKNVNTNNLSWNMLTWVNNIKLSSMTNVLFWKNAVINQIVDNKKNLDKNICSLVVWQIKKKYNKPGFQFAVLFFMFLLFYPFIRIILYILAFINFVYFKFMNWVWLYKFKKIVEEVEIIE